MLGLVILIFVGVKFCPSEPEDPTRKKRGAERSQTQYQRYVEALEALRQGGLFESETTDHSDRVQEFAFTVEEFISRFNYSLQNLENDTRVSQVDETDNGKDLTIELTSNRNIGFVLTANNVTRSVRDMIFIGGGDGTIRSGADLLMAMVAFVMAIENPSMPASQTHRITRDLGLHYMTEADNRTTKVVRHGVRYRRTWFEKIGMILVAEKLQPHVGGLRPSPPSPHASTRAAGQLRQQIEARRNRQRQPAPTVPQDLIEATTRPWPKLPSAAPNVQQEPQLAPPTPSEQDWKTHREVRKGVKAGGVTTNVPEPAERRVLSTGVTPPTVLSRIEPVYSEAARKAKLEGTVELSAVIRKDGSVEAVKVLRGLGLGLDESAIRALKSWQFRPGMKDGRPVDLRVNIEVTFSLRSPPYD